MAKETKQPMSPTPTCPQCGKPLPPDAPSGLCPQCLLAAAEQSKSSSPSASDSTTVTEPSPPQSPAPGGDAPGVEARRPARTGTRLRYVGDYELLEEIAHGGMGVVYKARQVSLNRTVAVKMVLAGEFASEAEVRRFRSEAEAAANLQHPNIVAIHEVGEHQGQQYFSMDYVAGPNLAQATRESPLSAEPAARLVKTMAEAIQYAHQRGVLHRDLKPQNVLLDERGEPRVTDFGLAKLAYGKESLTLSGAVMGSPGYMAPEQAGGRLDQVRPATDVYGLGAILYHLLTGQPPFAGATPMETMVKVVEEHPVSPRTFFPGIPSDLETIALKCLEKNPERRYATARALAEDLERFLRHEPVQARPASRTRKSWSWLQRHPWAIAGAAALLVVGLVVVACGVWQQGQFNLWQALHPGEVPVIGFRPLLIMLPFMFCLMCLANITVGRWFSRHFRRHQQTGAPIPGVVLGVCLAVGVGEVLYALVLLIQTVGLQPRLAYAAAAGGVGRFWLPGLGLYALPFLWTGLVLVWKVVGAHELSAFGNLVARSVAWEDAPEAKERKRKRASLGVTIVVTYTSCMSIALLLSIVANQVEGGRSTMSHGGVAGTLALWAFPLILLWRRPRADHWWREPKIPLVLAGAVCVATGLLTVWLVADSDLRDFLIAACVLGLLQGMGVQACWRAYLLRRQLEQALTPRPPTIPLGWSLVVRGQMQTWFVALLAVALVAIGYRTVVVWGRASTASANWERLQVSGQLVQRTNYLAKPIPDEVNFAATPLLRAVGYKYRLNTNLWAKLLPFERAVSDDQQFQLVTFGRALDLETLASRLGDQTNAPPRSRSQAADQVLQRLARVASNLNELRQAGLRPYAQIELVGGELGANPDRHTPHGLAHRLLGRLLLVRASAELAQGRAAEAQADLRAVRKLADALTANRFLSSTRLLVEITELWVAGFWEGWQAGLWDQAAIQEAAGWLASVDRLHDLALSLRGEEPYWANRAFEGVCAMSVAMPLFPFDWGYTDRLLYNQLLFGFSDAAFDASGQQLIPRRTVNADAAMRRELATRSVLSRNQFAIFPYLGETVRRVARVQTSVNQALIVCALTQYRSAHGVYPQALNQLQPEYLNRVPHDLIGGQPLHYQLTGDQSFILYSVGWDEKDDGGVPCEPGHLEPGDWVWPSLTKSTK